MLNGGIIQVYIPQFNYIHQRIIIVLGKPAKSNGPGLARQAGRDVPKEKRLLKLKNHSREVELIAVYKSDLMECMASGSTDI